MTTIALQPVAEPVRRSAPADPWWEHAKCRGMDPDLFFPERGEPTQHARAVCAGCAVRIPCLEDALACGDVPGVWGGLSARERRRILRDRRVLERERASLDDRASA